MSISTASDKPTGEPGAVIRAILTLRGRKPTDLAQILGISAGAASERLTGKVDFRNREIRAIAQELQVPPGLLYLTAEEVIARLIGMPSTDGTPRRLSLEGRALASVPETGSHPTLPGILSPALALVGEPETGLT